MDKTLQLINAPNLLSFDYTDCPDHIGLLNLPSLIDATICIDDCIIGHEFYKGKSNIIVGISNVQNLKLMGLMMKVCL
jgi:hypothetical protein